MLLTLKQPVQHCFHKSFHDYFSPTPPATSRFSPTVASSGSFLPPPVSTSSGPPQSMSTPHRGLPPPAAMNLPPPTQQTPQMGPQLPLNQPMGQLPAPPHQWQGAEESMRNWLHAKAEEEKRKQEEEKTRQETLRLEQRKIEQDMLRTSLAGGIPPYMVPMVFAGMGGGNLPNASLEWAQHYVNQAYQLQQQQQQQLVQQAGQPSPELRRDSRVPPQPYPAPIPPGPGPMLSTSGTSSSVSGPPSAGFLPGYQMSPASRSRQASAPGPVRGVSQGGQLPRLITEEMNIQQSHPGMPALPGQPGHPLQQSQTVQQPAQEHQPSPSIYFHHWQPPASQAPSTSTTQPISPDSVTSPRKRKATGPQAAAPAPTTRYTSPPFTQRGSSTTPAPSSRRRGHSRQRSDVSAGRGQESYGGAGSRHRAHTEGGMSSQTGGSGPQQSTYAPQEGPPSSMQSVLSFSQSQQQSRFPQQEQRYDTRQPPQGEQQQQQQQQQQRRYPAGPTDTRQEERQQRRSTPSDRDESQRQPHPPPETTQAPPR